MMYSPYIHLIDWCRHQKSFWYMLDIFWWQKVSRPFPCYVPPTSTYLSFCASLCRRVVECSFWWRSFVRMKSSSYTGRSILYVSWDSTSGWATASSCSITEAFVPVFASYRLWMMLSVIVSCLVSSQLQRLPISYVCSKPRKRREAIVCFGIWSVWAIL